MKLLYDQNLSFRLVRRLSPLYPDSVHVRDVGLSGANDILVLAYAAAAGFVIVSKDVDFHELSSRLGYPPKIVWIRRGNCSTHEIEAILRHHYGDLLAFERDDNSGSLIIF